MTDAGKPEVSNPKPGRGPFKPTNLASMLDGMGVTLKVGDQVIVVDCRHELVIGVGCIKAIRRSSHGQVRAAVDFSCSPEVHDVSMFAPLQLRHAGRSANRYGATACACGLLADPWNAVVRVIPGDEKDAEVMAILRGARDFNRKAMLAHGSGIPKAWRFLTNQGTRLQNTTQPTEANHAPIVRAQPNTEVR